MFFAQLTPLLPFVWEDVRLKDRQFNERRSHTQEHISAQFHSPERLETQLLCGPVPAGDPHASLTPESTELAELMIAKCSAQIRPELLSQFSQALAGTLAGSIITYPHKL